MEIRLTAISIVFNDMIGVFCRGGNRFRCNIDRTRNPEPFLIQDEEYGWMTDKARMLP